MEQTRVATIELGGIVVAVDCISCAYYSTDGGESETNVFERGSTYADPSWLVPGDQRERIADAIERLHVARTEGGSAAREARKREIVELRQINEMRAIERDKALEDLAALKAFREHAEFGVILDDIADASARYAFTVLGAQVASRTVPDRAEAKRDACTLAIVALTGEP